MFSGLSVGKAFVLGLVFGALINIPLVFPEIYNTCYHATTFDRVEIGMSYRDATQILERGGIWCGMTAGSSLNECYFSDIGRNYLIRLDPKIDRVMQKSVTVRRHSGFASWTGH